jgi:hypothetical protein
VTYEIEFTKEPDLKPVSKATVDGDKATISKDETKA